MGACRGAAILHKRTPRTSGTLQPVGSAGAKATNDRRNMAKKRSSSKAWLKEHRDDPYVQQAQREGYRSRACYKLLELQARDRLLGG